MKWLGRVEEFFFDNRAGEYFLGLWNLGTFPDILAPHMQDLRVLCVQTLNYQAPPRILRKEGSYDRNNRPLRSFDLTKFEGLEEVGLSRCDTGNRPDEIWRFLAPNLKQFVWYWGDNFSRSADEFTNTDGVWIYELAKTAVAKQVPLKDISISFGADTDDPYLKEEIEVLEVAASNLRTLGVSFHYPVKNVPHDVAGDLFHSSDDGEDYEWEYDY